MNLFTIGFTRKSARSFFETLKEAGVQRVVDVRLNNISQLAGFTKRDDLKYFLAAVADVDYLHCTSLAPTQDMLDDYKKRREPWSSYERRFLELMRERRVELSLDSILQDNDCLLCSEDKPMHCHRRLVAEYLAPYYPGLLIRHLS